MIRAPASPVGPLLVAVAAAWGVANLLRTPIAPLNDLAAPLQLAYAAILGHAVAAFPDGRRRSVPVVVATALAYPAALLPQPNGAIAVAALLALAAGWLSLARLHARSPGAWPSVVAVLFALTLGATTAVRWFVPGGFAIDPRPAVEIALIAAGAALSAATVRSAERRLRIGDLVVDLGLSEGGGLERQLATAMGDPTLEVAYALSDGQTYVDASGRVVALPAADGERAVTRIEPDGRPIAALIHDRAVTADAGIRAAIAHAAELVGTNARMQADVQRQASEVVASRRRLLDAADEERRALRRQLDDDLGPRLDSLKATLEHAPTPADEAAVEGALDQLQQIGTEMAAIADGLHPRLVEQMGLAGAVAELAGRWAVPVEISVGSAVRGATVAEAALYFVCSEALTNAAKHARAASISVRLYRSRQNLVVEVEDDGVGGADPTLGSGLRGLRDRVEALGGWLRVADRAGGGTVVRAAVPAMPEEAAITGS
jgi:signal transduction histidine kinase